MNRTLKTKRTIRSFNFQRLRENPIDSRITNSKLISDKRMTTNVSPFIEKLQQIINDSANSDIIKFCQINSRLQITNKKKLENILPKYFRHGKFESFVRQLNWYGFYKINAKGINSYSHPDLQKGIKLASIKSRRKSVNSKKLEENRIQRVEPVPQLNIFPVKFQTQTLALTLPFQNQWALTPTSWKNSMVIGDQFQYTMLGCVNGQQLLFPTMDYSQYFG